VLRETISLFGVDDALGMRALRMMYWRMLPRFCTNPKELAGTPSRQRGEAAFERYWRKSFLYRRCLIPQILCGVRRNDAEDKNCRSLRDEDQ